MSAFVYILFSQKNGTLYVGVTNDLIRRVYEHKNKFFKGFTARYDVDKLGYYEMFAGITEAIKEEKRLKAGSRAQKVELIETMNPTWTDLYNKIT
jgi:putative endonuclease